MVASGADENTPADAATTQVVVEDIGKVDHDPVVGEKRRERDDDVASLVPTVDAVTADDTNSQDSQATQDDEMHDVVAKMKETVGVDVAFDAAAAAAAVVPPPEPLKTDSATPVQDAVAAAAAAGVGADPNATANVKFDSKRMARVSFNSWFDFDSYFEMYMQETFQPFRMRSSCSVEAYRRNQQKKYRGIGCMAKINVKITPADNPSKYMVIVTDQVVTHNHPVSREIYEAYPDVLLKMMRRSQLSQSMLGHPPPPKFETPQQTQKYERAMNTFQSVAETMARLSDEDYEAQLGQLQRLYTPATEQDQTV
ncbi:Large Conductance Mechanosensitive Ion Channel (MscL) Family [Phytophthora nicotianae]|uniref:Large Conductance Mechanosensitive Ion Channel (MscL) Family n=1 Tax=Phytophthora nicotianae TaxID=4792 RepID=A0A0W8DDB1_PHYNI|nr:Large Conductance Mechanosensitive Ion Channel (MscL) Family [Phytophthora nicotianae]